MPSFVGIHLQFAYASQEFLCQHWLKVALIGIMIRLHRSEVTQIWRYTDSNLHWFEVTPIRNNLRPRAFSFRSQAANTAHSWSRTHVKTDHRGKCRQDNRAQKCLVRLKTGSLNPVFWGLSVGGRKLQQLQPVILSESCVIQAQPLCSACILEKCRYIIPPA